MSFESDLRKAERELEKKIGDIFRLATIDVMNSVVLMSPVDTGRFRANWTATLNRQAEGFNEAARSIPNIEEALGKVRLDDIMFLTNNLPYSETLVDNPSPRWIEKETYKASDYIIKRTQQVSD